MKKFKFQLETLLRVTRRKKDDAERDFADASRKVEEAYIAGRNAERPAGLRCPFTGRNPGYCRTVDDVQQLLCLEAGTD